MKRRSATSAGRRFIETSDHRAPAAEDKATPRLSPPDLTAIAAAARHLRDGRLVAFPTETVYGLGADATNGLATAAIFAAKGRPRFNPLIVHVQGIDEARRHAAFTPLARRLAGAFWPGPLTLVLPRRPDSPLADLVTAGLDTVALRVPSHPVARELLAAAGLPIAAPSANRSGHVSPTRAEHAAADLGGAIAMVLDGGPTVLGIESTILDASGQEPVLLRPGAISIEQIAERTGVAPSRLPPSARPSSPGRLASHYAPRARLRLDAREVLPGEALLAFGPVEAPVSGAMVNLSARGDLTEAAANLFAALRAMDRSGAHSIAVMPIPETGLGLAINDRLRRAAAPRTQSGP